MAFGCEDEMHVIVGSTLLAISIIILLSTFPTVYKYITSNTRLKRDSRETLKKKKFIYRIALIFIAITILALSTYIVDSIIICIDFIVFQYLFLFFYLLQTYCLLLLSIIRVHRVFQGTSLLFSKCAIRFRIGIFTVLLLCIILSTLTVFVGFNNKTLSIIESSATIIAFFLFVFLSISTLIIFIQRLIKVHQTTDDNELMRIITRLSVTTLPSITITLSVPIIIFFLYLGNLPEYMYFFIVRFIILCDIATNFWGMMLSFKPMDNYYKIICGCMDNNCKRLWEKKVIKSVTVISGEMTNHDGRNTQELV